MRRTSSLLRGARGSVSLRWSEAERAHRGDLQVFVCTYPPKPSRDPLTHQPVHIQPWQLEVQSGVRRLRPRVSPPEYLLVGYDGDGLGAVAMFDVRDAQEAFYLRAIARAWRLRGTHVADEAVRAALEAITVHPAYVERGYRDVYCEVHWKNSASQRMLRRIGFSCIGRKDELEAWAIDLGKPPAVIDSVEEAVEHAG